MEFVSIKRKMFGRLPYLRHVANVRQKACTEGGWVLDVPTLGGLLQAVGLKPIAHYVAMR